MNADELLPWVDTETFGLDPQMDPIVELGIKVTNLDLEVMFENSWLVWSPAYEMIFKDLQHNEDFQYVKNMHTKNGLWDAAQESGRPIFMVQKEATSWLEQVNCTGLPMCGSSVNFDRNHLLAQMPILASKFHYRIIDNSTLKELCRRYNPDLYEKLPPKKEVHRVNPDLLETIEEFRFYRNEFLLW